MMTMTITASTTTRCSTLMNRKPRLAVYHRIVRQRRLMKVDLDPPGQRG